MKNSKQDKTKSINSSVVRLKEEKNFSDILGYIICVIIFLTGVIFYIYPNVKRIDIMYELEAKKAKRNILKKKVRLFNLELASLKRLERIERLAKNNLGLINPGNEHIFFINVNQ